ncbi:MAG: glutaredoxin 3 [Natronospirillum sp.]|uniref:glutaredoxin 3 n=1 Tax=Natronospirillum sp. TaxID=2812955 RepID=UPI0025D9D68D|nr:glutaredoxin 3 [Natronospirillum sp.]MCH8550786.1 glutaredoxin 3 [Natronospirillum sp.]
MAKQSYAAVEELMSPRAPVVIYTTRFCPFCIRAKQLLASKQVDFDERPVDNDSALRAEMTKKAGSRTVPQIWIGDVHVGGCDELFQLERQQRLDDLLGRTQE